MTAELRLLDEYTQPDTSVPGPILDAWGVGYNGYGSILDKIGQLQFSIALKDVRDLRVVPGKAVQVWNTDLGEENVFLITERSVKANGDAVTATVTCPEVTQELQWGVVPGLVSTAAHQLSERLATLLTNVNIDWQYFAPPKPWLQWAVTNQITDLNGLQWNVRGENAAGCFGKLGKLYNGHWKKGLGRRIVFGRFGQSTGITLHRWATNPTGNETTVGEILGYEPAENAIGIVNDITGFGSGNANTAMDLSRLYGRSDFLGYDPSHPVQRRPRQDSPYYMTGAGDILWDYFIQDAKSILGDPVAGTPAWRRRMAYMTAADITPAGTTDAYLDAAAVALYQTMLTSLKYHAQPSNTLTVTTWHHVDIRDIAGKTVHVDIREVDQENNPSLTINQDYYVLEAKPVMSGDGWKCQWTLATAMLWEENLDTQIIGGLEAIKYFTTYASVFPSETNIWAENDLNATYPVTINVRENKRSVKTAEAKFTVTLKGVRSTAFAAAAGPHSHTVGIPALSVPIPSLSVAIPSTSVAIPSLAVPIPSLAVAIPRQGVPIPSQGVGVSGGAHDTSHNAGAHTHAIIGTKPFIDLKGVNAVTKANVGKNGESVVTDVLGTSSTGDHTHGSGVSGGAAYTVAPSNGSYGGFSISTATAGTASATSGASTASGSTSTASGATGTTTAATGTTTAATATSTAATATTTGGGEHGHAMVYDIYVGPLPTGVIFSVDGTIVLPYASGSNWFDYDATNLLGGQNRHTITVFSASLGRVQVEGLIVRYVTNGLAA